MTKNPYPAQATDAELLERFRRTKEEGALEEIIRRHGGLVLGVARRVLGAGSDADDVFQETILLLVQRSGSIRQGTSLGPWLHGVALRSALQARSAARVRKAKEAVGAVMNLRESGSPNPLEEVLPILDEELALLPEEYRRPIVLSYIEGRTHQELAQEMKRPSGSISYLLTQGLDLLRRRLAARGVEVTGAALGTFLASEAVQATVPKGLSKIALKAASSAARWRSVGLPRSDSGSVSGGADPTGISGAKAREGLGMAGKGATPAGLSWVLLVALLSGAAGGVFWEATRGDAEVPLTARSPRPSGQIIGPRRGDRAHEPGEPERKSAGTLPAPEDLAAELAKLREELLSRKHALEHELRRLPPDLEIPELPKGRELKVGATAGESREESVGKYLKCIRDGCRRLHSSILSHPETYIHFMSDPGSNGVCAELLVLVEAEQPTDEVVRIYLARGGMTNISGGVAWVQDPKVSPAQGDLYERLLLAGNPRLTGEILDQGLLPYDHLDALWPKLLAQRDLELLSKVIASLRSLGQILAVRVSTPSMVERSKDPELRRHVELLGDIWKKTQDWPLRIDLLASLKEIETFRSRELFWEGLGEVVRPGDPLPKALVDRLPECFEGVVPRPEEEDRLALLLSKALRLATDESSDAFELLGSQVFDLPLAKAARLMADLERDVPGPFQDGIRQILGQIASGETRPAVLRQRWSECGERRRSVMPP